MNSLNILDKGQVRDLSILHERNIYWRWI